MTSHTAMDLDQYLRLLEAYGADFERWPAEQRSSAERLVLQSEQARQARREAEVLDALLDQSSSPEPSDILRARVLGIPGQHHLSRTKSAPSSLGRAIAPALGLAAAALLGIAVGRFAYDPPAEQLRTTAVEMTSEDWNELTELAFATDLESEDWP